jgi:DNA polymerase V
MFLFINHAEIYTPVRGKPLPLPVVSSKIQAGFPSPAEDFADTVLDLNDLIKHPSATFIVRVSGDSMIGAGIHDGDLLIVDRSLEAKSNSIVIAVVEGDMTVKRLKRHRGQWWLKPENPDYPTAQLPSGAEIWGVVAHTIKNHT